MKITPKTKKVAALLRAAGDEHRLMILCVLFRDSNACVSEVAAHIGLNIAITSHHLRALAKAGLITPIRKGKHVCYKLTDSRISFDLKKFICAYK